MEHSSLFQEAVELIFNTNDKLTNKLEKNSIFGSSEDADELTKFTQCFSHVLKTLLEADEYNAVVYDDDSIKTWKTGCRLDDKHNQYAYLMYMPCVGAGNGLLRIEHHIYEGNTRPLHQIAYMLVAGQEPKIAKFTGWKVNDEDSTPDWEF